MKFIISRSPVCKNIFTFVLINIKPIQILNDEKVNLSDSRLSILYAYFKL
jgi:hypothetical protein